jgi:3-deoxy-D-manno-octulosonate 8-phosphate phosphatase (KDO 8-P phosphatase)
MKNRLEILGVKEVYLRSADKKVDFNTFLEKNGLQAGEILYMGDDLPDYEVMRMAGVPVCPADADNEIKQISSYISDKRGGEGCVRDVIEQVLRLHDQWMDHDGFTW